MNVCIMNKTNQRVLFPNAKKMCSFFERFMGLMGVSSLSDDVAYVFDNTMSLHTFFMRFSLAMIFLDKNMCVIKILKSVKPCRAVICVGAVCAVECMAYNHAVSHVAVGDVFDFSVF